GERAGFDDFVGDDDAFGFIHGDDGLHGGDGGGDRLTGREVDDVDCAAGAKEVVQGCRAGGELEGVGGERRGGGSGADRATDAGGGGIGIVLVAAADDRGGEGEGEER